MDCVSCFFAGHRFAELSDETCSISRMIVTITAKDSNDHGACLFIYSRWHYRNWSSTAACAKSLHGPLSKTPTLNPWYLGKKHHLPKRCRLMSFWACLAGGALTPDRTGLVNYPVPADIEPLREVSDVVIITHSWLVGHMVPLGPENHTQDAPPWRLQGTASFVWSRARLTNYPPGWNFFISCEFGRNNCL